MLTGNHSGKVRKRLPRRNSGPRQRISSLFRVEVLEVEAELQTVPIVKGFMGRTSRGEICLLGRGGSDTSGSLMAGAGSLDARAWCSSGCERVEAGC